MMTSYLYQLHTMFNSTHLPLFLNETQNAHLVSNVVPVAIKLVPS